MSDEHTEVRCNYGNCYVQLNPDGSIDGSYGPMACPCDLTRGWNRKYLAQQGKPHPPIKSRSPKVLRRHREAKELARMMARWEAAMARWEAAMATVQQ